MFDASSTYRNRVSRPKPPRNIPFEAQQLLYRFTYGSDSPSSGNPECYFTNNQDSKVPRISNIQSNITTPNYALWQDSPSISPSALPVVDSNPDPPSFSPRLSSSISNDFPIPSRPPLPKAVSREPRRERLRKTATVSNASQVTTANNGNDTQGRHRFRIDPSIRGPDWPPAPAPAPPARGRALAPARDRTRSANSSQSISRRHRNSESSTEYQSSGDSSDIPLVPKASPRRSHRARKDPQTYNVRALVGLELEPSEPSHSVNGSRATSERLSPKPPHVNSNLGAPQTPRNTIDEVSSDEPDFAGFLRQRQRGRFANNGYYKKFYADRLSKLTPWRRWKGASNDVISLAWAPDGTRFVAGATTFGDCYNRGNNLVLGDLTRNTLRELPDHFIPRLNPASTDDSRLFTTVSSTEWIGDRLYTASFDNTVKIWDTSQVVSCTKTLKHDAPVEVMSVSTLLPNRLATGTRKGFRLWESNSEGSFQNLETVRGPAQKNVDLTPTNLTWGTSEVTKNLLAGGMVQPSEDPLDFHVARYGHLALWKLEESSVTPIKLSPDSQNIFDIKWHPSLPIFAAASTVRDTKSALPGTQSLVNLYTYGSHNSRTIHSHAFSCPGVDINEVTFCPIGSNLVTASCTDGSTYVWDMRYPGDLLHQLRHGDPIHPVNHEYRREYADVGVRVALWGTSIDQFYTGGSDGVLKQWDIRRATEDTLIVNAAQLQDPVMCAAFSPDYAHLLVGDNGGGVQVLSSAPCADPERADFNFEYAPLPSESHQIEADEPSEHSGITAAQDYLSQGQLILHPIYGPVQGPQYSGPYARWARNVASNASTREVAQAPLLRDIKQRQFQGSAVQDRGGLDQRSRQDLQQAFNLAHACNSRTVSRPSVHQPLSSLPGDGHSNSSKRKRESSFISISSGDGEASAPAPKRTKLPATLEKGIQLGSQSAPFDLTSETTDDDQPDRQIGVELQQALTQTQMHSEVTLPIIPKTEGSEEDIENSLDEILSEDHSEILEELLEDDFWWPDAHQIDANIPRGADV
ncbi:hypothetical protein PENSTE_c005G07694 [Penicillium steckii]|uniref:Uncharacterized protein n=1 Tax=Penicillium steckii TaxID=303698 RepID=A0A1V6TIR4_9EURO|nr:hypothetical protein PENSTE_c005G07694 [Penicillium steckii]